VVGWGGGREVAVRPVIASAPPAIVEFTVDNAGADADKEAYREVITRPGHGGANNESIN